MLKKEEAFDDLVENKKIQECDLPNGEYKADEPAWVVEEAKQKIYKEEDYDEADFKALK
jgi:hypothetical protein